MLIVFITIYAHLNNLKNIPQKFSDALFVNKNCNSMAIFLNNAMVIFFISSCTSTIVKTLASFFFIIPLFRSTLTFSKMHAKVETW